MKLISILALSLLSFIPSVGRALILPDGASTEATLSSLNGKTTVINTGAVSISSSVALGLGAGTAYVGAVGVSNAVNVADVAPASINITVTDTASGSTTNFNSQVFTTGTATANSAASFAVTSWTSIRVEITGTWTGTLVFEQSNDSGVTWTAEILFQPGQPFFSATSTTSNFIGIGLVSGCTNFRVRATGFPSGTANVKIIQTVNPAIIYVTNTVKGAVDTSSTTDGLTEAIINFAASGDNTIVAGTASQTVRVYRIFFVVAAATNILIKDGAGTNLTGAMSFSQNGSFTLDLTSNPWFVTSGGNAFIINSSNAVQISGRAYYTKS